MNIQKQNIPPLHDVDIRLLRIFKSVVECGGLSAAEYTLGVGRSAISKHLSDLEARLTVRLCERGRSGFSITPYGETVYRATIELLDALDQFRTEISTAKGRLIGSLDLWLMDSLHLEPGNPTGRALGIFAEREGCMTLNVRTAGPEEAEEAVAARRATIAVTCSNSALSGLTYRPLAAHRQALYASGESRVAKELAKGANFSDLRDVDVITRTYIRRDPALPLKGWRSTAVAGDLGSSVALILSGRFIGVLPEHLARPWLECGRMIEIPGPPPDTEAKTYLVYRSKSRSLPAVRAVVQDIVSAYGADVGSSLD